MKITKAVTGNIKASIDRVALIQDAARMMGAVGAADALKPVEAWLYAALADVRQLQMALLRARRPRKTDKNKRGVR